MCPTVPFDTSRRVDEQLQYVNAFQSICKPFLFFALGVRVSVQAGFGLVSKFRMADGNIVAYPFFQLSADKVSMQTSVSDRMKVERETLPVCWATHFEVVILSEESDRRYTPAEMGVHVTGDHWSEDDKLGRLVPVGVVQSLLHELHEREFESMEKKCLD